MLEERGDAMDFQYWTQPKIVTKLSYVWHKRRSPETATDFHHHPANELIVVDHGTLEVVMSGVSHILKPGCGIYIPRYRKHRVVPKLQSTDFVNIIYRGRQMPELAEKELTLSGEAADALARLLKLSNPPLNARKSELAACRLSELLLLLLPSGTEFHESHETKFQSWNKHYYRSEKTCRILEHLNKHFAEKITLEQLAGIAGLSQSHLRTLLKKETGLSFTAHLHHLRIADAKRHLLGSSLSISEIAVKCGFPSLPFFFQVFRRHTGMTPQEYAKTFGDTENPTI